MLDEVAEGVPFKNTTSFTHELNFDAVAVTTGSGFIFSLTADVPPHPGVVLVTVYVVLVAGATVYGELDGPPVHW